MYAPMFEADGDRSRPGRFPCAGNQYDTLSLEHDRAFVPRFRRRCLQGMQRYSHRAPACAHRRPLSIEHRARRRAVSWSCQAGATGRPNPMARSSRVNTGSRADHDMLQLVDFERVLIDQMIPVDRDAL
jgi:hypothetical protein